MIHEERPNSRGLGSLVKLSSDLKVDSPDVAEETRTELLEKLRLDSTRRAHLLEQHRAESNMEDSRRHSRIHKRPGYEAMRERHEHRLLRQARASSSTVTLARHRGVQRCTSIGAQAVRICSRNLHPRW